MAAAAVYAPAPAPLISKPTLSSYSLPPSPPLSDEDEDLQQQAHVAAATTGKNDSSIFTNLEYERPLGETELSYFLPSREDGVNDMYHHVGLSAPAALFTPARIRAAWALSRLRHPPLATTLRMEPGVYDSARYVYAPPRSVSDALAQAGAAIEFPEETKDEVLDRYLNGPRTLGPHRLAYMFVASVPPAQGGDFAKAMLSGLPTPAASPGPDALTSAIDDGEDRRDYDIFLCTTHFLGDGMSLGRFMNEFLELIGGRVSVAASADQQEHERERTTEEIESMLQNEWEAQWGSEVRAKEDVAAREVLPRAMEDALPALPPGCSMFRAAATKVDFENSQKKLIGYHAFPRARGKPRRTIVPTMSLDEARSRKVLKTCKAHGVSVSNALFALSALSWSRMQADVPGAAEKPLMMYSALNMRPYLVDQVTKDHSYWFTAIGYMNLILPNFLPKAALSPSPSSNSTSTTPSWSALQSTFWHRARSIKAQTSTAVKSPLLIGKTRAMAAFRGERARAWAVEDDARAAGTWVNPPKPTAAAPTPSTTAPPPWQLPPAPSTALLGLSMLGNLDGVYIHAHYPSLKLHRLMAGSRQRSGALLAFVYTFVGRLWLSLGYDVDGFEEGVVERWWEGVVSGVDELLVGEEEAA